MAFDDDHQGRTRHTENEASGEHPYEADARTVASFCFVPREPGDVGGVEIQRQSCAP